MNIQNYILQVSTPKRELKSVVIKKKEKIVRLLVQKIDFNPLSANHEHIQNDTVITSDSCNSGHSENYEQILTFSYKSLKFSTKWYTKLCILVDPFLRNCVAKTNFRSFFLKKGNKKKALALKGLKLISNIKGDNRNLEAENSAAPKTFFYKNKVYKNIKLRKPKT